MNLKKRKTSPNKRYFKYNKHSVTSKERVNLDYKTICIEILKKNGPLLGSELNQILVSMCSVNENNARQIILRLKRKKDILSTDPVKFKHNQVLYFLPKQNIKRKLREILPDQGITLFRIYQALVEENGFLFWSEFAKICAGVVDHSALNKKTCDEIFSDQYILYYDETNNPRTFKITDNGFNVNEHEFFILGGIGFEADKFASMDDIKELFDALLLQTNVNEVKFRHIRQNAQDFLTLISNPRVATLIGWLYDKKYLIHYSYVDNFYYTIVDIVDSMEESWFGGPELNRELKNSLYLLIKENQDWFLSLLIEMDYPNIKNHNKFVEKLVEWIWSININDDFYLEYLRQSLKSYKEKQLIFLQDNEDRVAIGDYSNFYANLIITYPNANHIFDHELLIEEILNANPIELFGHESIDYNFVDSKDERLVQVSDLIIGVLRYWMAFLESRSIQNIREILNEISEIQKITLKKFQEILLYSLSISTGFKHGVSSNDFELKINFFLEYDF